MKKIKIPDDTLKGLLIGILIFEILAELIGLPFVKSVMRYSIGLWIGALLAVAAAIHMWWTIDKNLTVNADNESASRAYAIRQGIIRYVVILAVFVVICLTDFAYPLAAFLGIMGLKAGAYIQPQVDKIMKRSSK